MIDRSKTESEYEEKQENDQWSNDVARPRINRQQKKRNLLRKNHKN